MKSESYMPEYNNEVPKKRSTELLLVGMMAMGGCVTTPASVEHVQGNTYETPVTEDQLAFVNEKMQEKITPELLEEAGINGDQRENIIEEMPHLTVIIKTKEGKREVKLAVNRDIFQNGAKIFIDSHVSDFTVSSTTERLSHKEELESLRKGIKDLFDNINLPNEFVASSSVANVPINLYPSDSDIVKKGYLGNVQPRYIIEEQVSFAGIVNIGLGREKTTIFDKALIQVPDDAASVTDEVERKRIESIIARERLKLNYEHAGAHELIHAFGYRGHALDGIMRSSPYISLGQVELTDESNFTIKDTHFKLFLDRGDRDTGVWAALRLVPILLKHGF